MHEIICPHCSKAFKIDEAGYADILKQVRDGEFDQALHERLELAEREKHARDALAKAKVDQCAAESMRLPKTPRFRPHCKAQLDAGEVANKLALNEALGTVEQRARCTIANELAQAKQDQQDAIRPGRGGACE